MIKNKLFFLSVIYALCSMLCHPQALLADDFDPFIYDAEYGDDAYFTDANISASAPVEFNAAPIVLNQGARLVNVNGFDIAGIYLGMPFEDVQALFFTASSIYAPRKKDSVTYTVSNDWKYNLDYECRQQKINIPADLEKCITSLARKRGLLYPSELHLVRESTGETIEVHFTSNATDNTVWRVIYKNDANSVEGSAEKFANQRDKKILAFWQGVLDKYGPPNSGEDRWISNDNSFDPMMTAYFGMLDLVDQGRLAEDIAKNVSDARENFRAKPYAF